MTQRFLIATALVSLVGCSGAPEAAAPDDPATGTATSELKLAPGGAIFTQTNEASGNRVLAFARHADGTLDAPVSYSTTGTGSGDSLGSQGSLVLTDDRRFLIVTNAGSSDVSTFRVDGAKLAFVTRVDSQGTRPTSVAERGGVVVVLNAGGDGNVASFHLDSRGDLRPTGSPSALSSTSAGPAEVALDPAARFAVVTEKNTNDIDVYGVERGRLMLAGTAPSAGKTPYGFDFDSRGHIIVSEAATTSVSSYDLSRRGSLSVVSAVISDTQAAPCWVVVSKDDRFAYVANAGSSSISSYSVDRSGDVQLVNARAGETGEGSHPLDMDIDASGKYLYVLDSGESVVGFRIARDGDLDAITSAGTLPPFAAGVAAY
ncbi:MAG TPA: beta-propeller fold lactonase family protein [Polyangiaceae bacterium]|nr:beta-propeller fold lactonase family protein [Polyangiaceae bacterium]